MVILYFLLVTPNDSYYSTWDTNIDNIHENNNPEIIKQQALHTKKKESVKNDILIDGKKRKLLFVNSYHQGFKWSDDIEKGLLKALSIKKSKDGSYNLSQSSFDVKFFRMNSKIDSSKISIEKAALRAKELIEKWKPDILVASDDNAAKYLLVPYYRNKSLPTIFCGVNGDASIYGFPTTNITGMVEIAPIHETIRILKNYAKGEKIGYLGSSLYSSIRNIEFYEKKMNITFSKKYLANTYNEWKLYYSKLQQSVDLLIITTPIGIKDWKEEDARNFIHNSTKIPSGSLSDDTAHYSLISRSKIAEEQGWWAGKTALRIINGTPPNEIPITTNKMSNLYLNTHLANKMGIKFPVEMMEKANLVEAITLRGE